MAATDVVNSLQREVEIVKEGLRSVDETIKKLTGRDPSEPRGPVGTRRVLVKRTFGERIGGPPQKRFITGNTYGRPGPRLSAGNREQRYRQLESDGEEEEDDIKKPTIQSSVVATPTPSRLQQNANTDKKTQTRNKRMFGVLLGTLQKFKESSNREAARERRRQEIEKKLEETAEKEREEAIRQRKELFFARKEKQAKLEELERKMEVAEMLDEWEKHDRKLTKFIRTKTKPHLFYLPAKHNVYTYALLDNTAETIEEDIQRRRMEVKEALKPKVDEEDQDVQEDEDKGETQENDQEKGGRQELEEREEEDDVGMKENVQEGDKELAQEAVNDEHVEKEEVEKVKNESGEKVQNELGEKVQHKISEKVEEEQCEAMEEAQGKDERQEQIMKSEVNENVERNGMKDENQESEMKDDGMQGQEDSAMGDDQEENGVRPPENEVAGAEDEKKEDMDMQVDPGPNEAQ